MVQIVGPKSKIVDIFNTVLNNIGSPINLKKNYCCPIKVYRLKKIWLGYRFRGGRVCFFDFQAHSVEE